MCASWKERQTMFIGVGFSCTPEGCVFGLTCVGAVLVSGAVAVNGEGGASEFVACCC